MIYFIQAGENGPIKIGSSDNPVERMAQLQTANAAKLKLLWTHTGDATREQKIHKLFRDEKIRGEWYNPSQKLMASVAAFPKSQIFNIEEGRSITVSRYMDGRIQFYMGTFTITMRDDNHIRIDGPEDWSESPLFIDYNGYNCRVADCKD